MDRFMIEFLRGTLQFKQNDHAVIECNGVGYGLDLTAAAARTLPSVGESAEVHVYLYMQEAILRLYAFASRQERELFEIFLNTSGIGPRTAMSILSHVEIPVFARALMQGDLRTLTSVPGIGKKTAERLALELKDKLQLYADMSTSTPAETGEPDATTFSPGMIQGQSMREAVEALIALGCKPLVAERAVLKAVEVLGPGTKTPELVKEGLKHRY
jgi:Holliday junction DNA helicase RuvA